MSDREAYEGDHKFKFGAFIMTFERPRAVLKCIETLQQQNFPPQKILVVDNSLTFDTKENLKTVASNVEYYRVGHNSGPAGAAKLGLQKLYEDGFDWIYWGDDNNPPGNYEVFSRMFSKIEYLIAHGIEPGLYSGKGGCFNQYTGRVRSLANSDLNKASDLEVDVVPGGHNLLVNSEVLEKGIFPDEKLFFGFEELDYSIRIKKAGFRLFIDAEGWLDTRIKAGNTASSYSVTNYSFGREIFLERDYYSSRNLLYIFYRHSFNTAFVIQLFKIFGKLILGFCHGKKYGQRNFKLQIAALKDFFTGRLGKADLSI